MMLKLENFELNCYRNTHTHTIKLTLQETKIPNGNTLFEASQNWKP